MFASVHVCPTPRLCGGAAYPQGGGTRTVCLTLGYQAMHTYGVHLYGHAFGKFPALRQMLGKGRP